MMYITRRYQASRQPKLPVAMLQIPYCPQLLLLFDCHLNVEISAGLGTVKYLSITNGHLLFVMGALIL